MTVLHSNEQLRTERGGNTEKGCQKPAVAYSRRLLMMMRGGIMYQCPI